MNIGSWKEDQLNGKILSVNKEGDLKEREYEEGNLIK